jgi:hypothetical protein
VVALVCRLCSVAPSIDYWTSAVPSTVFPPRYDFTPVIDSLDRVFVIAGLPSESDANYAWMSLDAGSSWSCQSCIGVANSTRGPPRLSVGTTAVGSTIVIAGGANSQRAFNDVSARWHTHAHEETMADGCVTVMMAAAG